MFPKPHAVQTNLIDEGKKLMVLDVKTHYHKVFNSS